MKNLNILPYAAKVTLSPTGIAIKYDCVRSRKLQGKANEPYGQTSITTPHYPYNFTIGKEYQAIGIGHKVWSDGEAMKVIVLQDDDATIVEKAIEMFSVV